MRPAARMTPKLSLTWLSQIIFCENLGLLNRHKRYRPATTTLDSTTRIRTGRAPGSADWDGAVTAEHRGMPLLGAAGVGERRIGIIEVS